jgi:hypothetical protein
MLSQHFVTRVVPPLSAVKLLEDVMASILFENKT